MIYLILVFTLLHVVFYGYLAIGWKQIRLKSISNQDAKFSVIIPARNEEKVIQRVLACLSVQDYPKDRFEVIVVDDFSEDGTVQRVKECLDKMSINLKVISLKDTTQSGKKHALTKGVHAAQFEHILTTDADCHMGPQWISSYANSMGDKQFVAGPVAIKGKGLFAQFQQTEFAGLIGFGAVTLNHNNPSMCSGANLGFTKKAFLEVGGYENNIRIPSGDDEFLLYNILKKFPGEAMFLKDKTAIVITPAQSSLGKFINQRTRWTSKWKHNKNWKLRMMAILFFMDYLLYYLLIAGMFLGNFTILFTVAIMLIRLSTDYFYMHPIARFHGHRKSFIPVLLIQIIYPLHVLFMGMSSIFGSYTWKGRRY